MSLRLKAWLVSVIVLLSLLGIMYSGLEVMRKAAGEDNEARIRQILATSYNTIVSLENMAAAGTMTDEQAKAIATQLLRENKYHKSEYVYVTDENLVFIAAPTDEGLHGKAFGDILLDGDLKSVGLTLDAALKKSGGAMTTYAWTSRKGNDLKNPVVHLLSVAQQTPRWHWVVGNGISFKEADERFWKHGKEELGICVCVFALVAGLMLFAVEQLLRQLGGEPKEVMRLMQALAEGDLAGEVREHKATRTSIYGSVLRMRNSLKDMLGQLSLAIAALHRTSEDIVTKAQDSSRMVGTQSIATQRIAKSVDIFSEQTQHAGQQAETAHRQSESAIGISAQGQHVITTAVTRLSEIEQAVGETQTSIGELAQRVLDISEVISVIRDVAFQTNLLALNATIEAARAGELGRGFAVVADEVRKLAERSSSATHEIEKNIETVQASSQIAKTQMDKMVEQLKEGINKAKAGGEAVMAIRRETEATALVVNEIEQTLSQQVKASRSIRQDVDEVAQSSESTLGAVRDTVHSAEAIKQVSLQLEGQVKRFKL